MLSPVRPVFLALLALALPAWQEAPGAALAPGSVMIYVANGRDTLRWPVDSVHRDVEQGGRSGAVRVFFGARPDAPAPFARTVWSDGQVLHEWEAREGRWVAQRPLVPGGRLASVRANGDTVRYDLGARRSVAVGGLRFSALETTVTTVGPTGAVKRRLVELYAPALLTALEGEFARPDPGVAGSWLVDQRFRLVELASRAP
jgi:hypothetical protein